jgi:DNA-binding transcriptional regulator YiaG
VTFAQQLKKWQGTRTADEAARDLGVSSRTLENWLQGRNKPGKLARRALAPLLNPKPAKP